jgi:hypothetical protein
MRYTIFLLCLIPALAWAGDDLRSDEKIYLCGGIFAFMIIGEMSEEQPIVGTVISTSNVGLPANNSYASGSPAQQAPQQEPALELSGMNTKTVESNKVWTKVSWRATVRNPANISQSGWLEINVLDSKGFVVDSHPGPRVALNAGDHEDYSDFILIDANLWEQAHKIQITLETSSY